MKVCRERARRLATEYAESIGYRVVASFEGLTWEWATRPRSATHHSTDWDDGRWAVLFRKMPAVDQTGPWTEDLYIRVSAETGECWVCQII